MSSDLHIHTTASDGKWEPERIGEIAYRLGLSYISITDHDSTEGIALALKGAPHGISIISGIELGAYFEHYDIHILGYGFDYQDQKLQNQLAKMRDARFYRAQKMVERLNELGMEIDLTEIVAEAKGENIGRLHFANVMMARGYVKTRQEAFEKFLNKGQPAYIERFKLTVEKAIKLIYSAGGLAVLAHPGAIGFRSLEEEIASIRLFQSFGLKGIEVIHPEHSEERTSFYSNLASELNLLPTGGSDCHGPSGKDTIMIGKWTIPDEWAEQLLKQSHILGI